MAVAARAAAEQTWALQEELPREAGTGGVLEAAGAARKQLEEEMEVGPGEGEGD